jgi:hypothetical protein
VDAVNAFAGGSFRLPSTDPARAGTGSDFSTRASLEGVFLSLFADPALGALMGWCDVDELEL